MQSTKTENHYASTTFYYSSITLRLYDSEIQRKSGVGSKELK